MPVFTGDGGDNVLVGGSGDDQIFGLGGNDSLSGGAGNDLTDGGAGNDRHFIDDAGDTVVELAGEGDDMVLCRVSYVLTALAEVEVLTTINNMLSTAINLTGNEFANSIYGNQGNNILIGGGGADYLVGLGGDDTYGVDNAGDIVIEASSSGNDTVAASVSYDLRDGAFVEVLTTANAAGLEAINLSGSESANSIYGNAGANTLNGEGGADYLVGGAGNDVLIGGAAADVMIGGIGNDIYSVDDVSDLYFENEGEGDDIVLTSINHTLRAGVSIEVFAALGAGNLALTGNELANSIYGNGGDNALNGGGGDDYLVGQGGNDTLDGGAGFDVMRGGTGDDIFILGNNGPADAVFEASGEGNDAILLDLGFITSYRLAAGEEIETLSARFTFGFAALDLYGNEFANTLIGNSFHNILNGEGGDDIMIGGGGADTYYVSEALDQVIETEAGGSEEFYADRVYVSVSYALAAGSRVEVLSTYWHQGNETIDLTGNEFANTLLGNFAANRLNGGAGADSLTGFGGADSFTFTTALGTVDTIRDFEAGIDRILLDDAIFTALSPGALPPGAFTIGTGAGEADDRIIYDAATGALFYDADGAGGVAQVQFASLINLAVLTAADFTVI